MDITSNILQGQSKRALLVLSAQVQVHDQLKLGSVTEIENVVILLESASRSANPYVKDALRRFIESLTPQQLCLLKEMGVEIAASSNRLAYLVEQELEELLHQRIKAGIPESKKKIIVSHTYRVSAGLTGYRLMA